jgi:heat shock protein HslJ
MNTSIVHLVKKISFIVLVLSLFFGAISKNVQAAEGDLWITPVNTNSENNQEIDIEVRIDTGTKHLNSLDVYLDFNSADVTVDVTKGEDVNDDMGRGFHKGADTSGYTMGSNSEDIANGHFRIIASKPSGGATGNNVHIATIHLKTTNTFTSGSTNLTLRLGRLADNTEGDLVAGTITPATITYQDLAAPVLAEVTAIVTPTNDTTPSYTFSSTESGTISYGGSCNSSSDTVAVAGNNTITFDALVNGTYNDCTVIVTDAAANASTALAVTAFTVDDTIPTVAEVTAVATPSNNTTPTYVYSYTNNTGLGTPDWNGSCDGYFSETASSVGGGNNSTTASSEMPEGNYDDCTLTITDEGTANSGTINVTPFTIDTTAPADPTVSTTPVIANDGTAITTTLTNVEEGTTVTVTGMACTPTPADATNTVVCTGTVGQSALDGTNNTVTVTDGAGNVNTNTSIGLTVDNVAPVLAEVTAINTITNDNTPTYVFSSSEDGTAVLGGSCAPASPHVVNITAGNVDFVLTELADDIYADCIITVTDSAGNDSVINIPSFTVDATMPAVDEITPVVTPTNDTTPEITLQFSEHIDSLVASSGCMVNKNSNISSGQETFTISVDGLGTPLTEGTYGDGGATACSIANITDDAGNVNLGPFNFSQFTIDTTAPVITEVTAISTPTNDSTPDYTFSSDEAGTISYGGSCNSGNTNAISGSNTITFDPLANGVYNDCTITVTDSAGNSSNIISIPSFTVDAENPTLAEVIAVPTPGNDTTPSYTFSSTEAGTIIYGGSCDSVSTSATVGDNVITFNALAEGTYSDCTIMVKDVGDNNSNVLSVTSFTIDATAPVITEVTAISTPTVDSTPDYTFSSTEGGTITYGGDCSSDTVNAISGNNTITFNSLSEAAHSNCTITVTDNTANVSNVLNVTPFTVISAPTCTGFTYSSWISCQANNRQTRTVVSTIPAVCTGGSPVLEQSCTYIPPVVVGGGDFNDFTPKVKLKGLKKKYKLDRKKKLYLKKKKVKFRGKAKELVGKKVQLFIDGKLQDEDVIGEDGKWKLGDNIKKSGSHKIRFKYFDEAGNFIGESSKYKIKIDTKKPRFIKLPRFLTKRVGDKVTFEATDSKSKKIKTSKRNKIKYYKYYFDGKKHKTKKPYFYIPKGTAKGLHTLKIRAYDKAGNKAKRTVVIRVR